MCTTCDHYMGYERSHRREYELDRSAEMFLRHQSTVKPGGAESPKRDSFTTRARMTGTRQHLQERVLGTGVAELSRAQGSWAGIVVKPAQNRTVILILQHRIDRNSYRRIVRSAFGVEGIPLWFLGSVRLPQCIVYLQNLQLELEQNRHRFQCKALVHVSAKMSLWCV